MKFSDPPIFIFNDYLDALDPYGHVYPKAGHLMGNSTGIIAAGGFGFDVFLKFDRLFYRLKVRHLLPFPDDNSIIVNVETNNYKPSELTLAELDDYISEYGNIEIYVKKGGGLHNFINTNSQYDNYVNTNKVLLYLGEIFPYQEEGHYLIKLHNIRDYAITALPYNNRNDNLGEFLNVSLDKVYSKVYSMIKNLWSLQDPKEVDEKYFGYLYDMYGIEELPNISDEISRECISGLPYLLKRKGTYASLYIIYKNIFRTENTKKNYLNVYERWHSPGVSAGDILEDEFIDYLYTNYPNYREFSPIGGAGPGYYHGVTSTPCNEGYYLHSEPTTAAPVSASNEWIVHHNLDQRNVAVELIDLGNKEMECNDIEFINENTMIVTFDEPTAGYAAVISGTNKIYTSEVESIIKTYLHEQTHNAVAWLVEHNLGQKYVTVEVVDSNNFLLKPEIKYLTENSLLIKLDSATIGSAIVIGGVEIKGEMYGTYTHRQTESKKEWIVIHNLGKQYVKVDVTVPVEETYWESSVIHIVQTNIDPLSVEFVDENSLKITLESESTGYAICTFGGCLFEQNYPNFCGGESGQLNALLDFTAIPGVFDGMTFSDYILYGEPDAAFYESRGSYSSPGASGGSDCLIISPHYRVELDLTNEPFGYDYIIDENSIDSFISRCEDMRPVTRFSHYNMIISPLATSLGDEYVSLYNYIVNSKAYLNTKFCRYIEESVTGMVQHTINVATSPWEINHQLGSTDLIVQCFDSEGNMFEPIDIEYLTPNFIRINLAYDMTGIVLIVPAEDSISTTNCNFIGVAGGPGFGVGICPSSEALPLIPYNPWVITHALEGPIGNTQYIFNQVNDENGDKTFIPLSITVNNLSVTINFATATAGTALLGEGEYLHTQAMPSPIWNIEHNLNGSVQIQCYDGNDNLVYPEEIDIYNEREATVKFGDNYVSGHAIIKRVGFGISDFDVSYFKIGTEGGQSWDPMVHNDVENEVYRNTCTLQSDDDYYYIYGVASDNNGYWGYNISEETGLPASTIEAYDINITEMAVFNENDNIVFYTYCSTIHKPVGVDLRLWFRVKK